MWCNVGALSLSPLSFTSLVRTGGIVQCSPGMASCSSCVITGNTNRWSMASLKSALPPSSLRFPTMAAATSFQSKPKPKSKLLLRSFNGLAPLQPSLFPTSCPGTFHHYPLFKFSFPMSSLWGFFFFLVDNYYVIFNSCALASSLFCFLRISEVKIENFAWLCIVIYLSYPYNEQSRLIFLMSFFFNVFYNQLTTK